MAKSKKWIRAEKAKTSKTKNPSQLEAFFTSGTKQIFTKLRQRFVKLVILNHFNLEHYI